MSSSISARGGSRGAQTGQRGKPKSRAIRAFKNGGAGGYRSRIARTESTFSCAFKSGWPLWNESQIRRRSGDIRFANAVIQPAAFDCNARVNKLSFPVNTNKSCPNRAPSCSANAGFPDESLIPINWLVYVSFSRDSKSIDKDTPDIPGNW